MSRTEGINLPRLPTSHAGAVSSNTIKPHSRRHPHLSEPNYTAFVGTPRQDIPRQVYNNAVMFDDVFDKQGRLLTGRTTPKMTNPLNSLHYNSLHDPHCQRLFLNNQALRTHLIQLGLLTDDLRVVSTTKEQRQKIRAHELLERKELLIQKMDEKEKKRLEKLQNNQLFGLPKYYSKSLRQCEENKLAWEALQKIKVQRALQKQVIVRKEELEKKKERKVKLHILLEQIEMEEQTRRNFAHLKQKEIENKAYKEKYGKVAVWYKESDDLHNKIVLLSRTKWSKTEPKLDKVYSHVRSLTVESSMLAHQEDNRENNVLQQSREALETTSIGSQPKEKETITQEVNNDEPKQIETIQEEAQLTETPIISILPSMPSQPSGDIPVPQQKIPVKENYLDILVDFLKELLLTRDNGYGYISFDDLYLILSSTDMDLPLDHDELIILTETVFGSVASDSDVIHIDQASLVLPQQMLTIFRERMNYQLTQYGMLVEETWLQFSPSVNVYLYVNKMTGHMQLQRPHDYRPFLKDDPFEDIISGLFLSADVNRDGYIDYNDFHTFLQSSYMNERVYTEQIEEILYYYTELAREGGLSLEQFVPLAHLILQMIYGLAHPNEEWVELDLKKGKFLYNPFTGQFQNSESFIKKPPPLRKRTKSFNFLEATNKKEESVNNKDTKNLIEEVAEKLQTEVRIIDTIPEEVSEEDDETEKNTHDI